MSFSTKRRKFDHFIDPLINDCVLPAEMCISKVCEVPVNSPPNVFNLPCVQDFCREFGSDIRMVQVNNALPDLFGLV